MWYDQADATYITLVDENHTISSLFNLVNVPSAVWIDEHGKVVRIDEGAYSKKHNMGDFEFGRDDYVPMVADWIKQGDKSQYVTEAAVPDLALSSDQALADANFKLGVFFKKAGDDARAAKYWAAAQALRDESWNYARQDWSFGASETASKNWAQKFESLEGEPYYRPIEGLDPEQ